jgi:hypothetical protein
MKKVTIHPERTEGQIVYPRGLSNKIAEASHRGGEGGVLYPQSKGGLLTFVVVWLMAFVAPWGGNAKLICVVNPKPVYSPETQMFASYTIRSGGMKLHHVTRHSRCEDQFLRRSNGHHRGVRATSRRRSHPR